MAAYGEWEIKNFSCWSGDIHGEKLGLDFITLYPRGVGRIGEYIGVKIDKWRGVRKLSFIGSDGSVICTRRPDDDSQDDMIINGPKFEEVVAGIRGNEPLNEDRLILRWERPLGTLSARWRTVLDAYSAFFHLKPEVLLFEELGGMRKILKLNNWKTVCSIYNGSGLVPFMKVYACKTGSTPEDTTVKFKLCFVTGNHLFGRKKFLVRTSIWMVNGDHIVQQNEKDYILLEGADLILPFKVLLKDLEGLPTIMRCKIISRQSCQKLGYVADFPLSPDIGITGFSSFCEIKSFRNAENAVTTLTKDLMSLYQDHNFSDFELCCGNVSFPTHRGILSARSPVLKAMLSTGMKEAASGSMDIDDLDPQTLADFLAFLYSGTSRKDLEWEGAIGLYYAADKYQVPSLKKECAAIACARASLETVCDILSLAEKHQDEVLRSVAHNFIVKNFEEVLGSKHWELFMRNDSLLAVETLTSCAKDKYVKKSGLLTENQEENGESLAKRLRM